MNIWIGSPIEVYEGDAADQYLSNTNDSQYYTKDGITTVPPERWAEAQKYERDSWMIHYSYATTDRAEEHAKKFENYQDAAPLGNVIEIGCGPFTQLATICALRQEIPTSITLIDPLIEDYLDHPHCAYKKGKMVVNGVEQPVCIAGLTGENIFAAPSHRVPQRYDTVVMINVLEHVHNATAVLNNIRNLLRPGGQLILHERTWEKLDPLKVYDVGHPIRIHDEQLRKHLSGYTLNYHTCEPTEYGMSHYFMGILPAA